MLIQLPDRVWMDILDWLRAHRRKLAIKFNKFGDRTFADICQHWLHEHVQNVQLGILHIDLIGRLNVWRNGYGWRPVPIADVPMPENITAFQEIRIQYLDPRVFNFLRQILAKNRNINHSINNLTIDSGNIYFRSVEEIMGRSLDILLPQLFNGIGSINFCRDSSFLFSSILDQFPGLLHSVKLINLRALSKPNFQAILRWLRTPRTDADADPRIALFSSTYTWEQFYEVIRQQFMAATSPVSFYIGISSQRSKITFQQSSHENIETGEQLIIRRPPREYLDLVIARCPSTVDVQGWLQQMDRKAEEIEGQDIPKISVNGTQTGPSKMQFGREEEERDDDARQLGPSKKLRLT